MFRLVASLSFALTACQPTAQPESNQTVAAYEVPLPTTEDKEGFLALLSEASETEGFHVDAATQSELEAMSQVSPITFNASVWRGDDEEIIASAMDFEDRIGRVWISFRKGEDVGRSRRFRETLVPMIKDAWPDTASLPIMPNGALPLTRDLVLTKEGYEIRASEAAKYERSLP